MLTLQIWDKNSYENSFLDKEQIEKEFHYAWLHHIHNNKHHPEYWTYVDEYYKPVVLDMPPIYIAEMLLDHQAMGYKFGDNAYNYYQKTKDKKPYSDKTKKIIESVIDIFNK